jgi:hypothetical protein
MFLRTQVDIKCAIVAYNCDFVHMKIGCAVFILQGAAANGPPDSRFGLCPRPGAHSSGWSCGRRFPVVRAHFFGACRWPGHMQAVLRSWSGTHAHRWLTTSTAPASSEKHRRTRRRKSLKPDRASDAGATEPRTPTRPFARTPSPPGSRTSSRSGFCSPSVSASHAALHP